MILDWLVYKKLRVREPFGTFCLLSATLCHGGYSVGDSKHLIISCSRDLYTKLVYRSLVVDTSLFVLSLCFKQKSRLLTNYYSGVLLAMHDFTFLYTIRVTNNHLKRYNTFFTFLLFFKIKFHWRFHLFSGIKYFWIFFQPWWKAWQ